MDAETKIMVAIAALKELSKEVESGTTANYIIGFIGALISVLEKE